MDAVSLTRAKPKCKRCRGEIRETPNEIDKFISEVL